MSPCRCHWMVFSYYFCSSSSIIREKNLLILKQSNKIQLRLNRHSRKSDNEINERLRMMKKRGVLLFDPQHKNGVKKSAKCIHLLRAGRNHRVFLLICVYGFNEVNNTLYGFMRQKRQFHPFKCLLWVLSVFPFSGQKVGDGNQLLPDSWKKVRNYARCMNEWYEWTDECSEFMGAQLSRPCAL